MMHLEKWERPITGTVHLPRSKSISNRLLILQALFPSLQISGLSDAADTQVLADSLGSVADAWNVGHAGTAFRFLTAYAAQLEGRTITLTGSERMKQRPIAVLVDALKELGAEIHYLEKEGYPPLRIIGKKLSGNRVTIPAHVSSQYITALMLIAPSLEKGLTIERRGERVSSSYVEMTAQLMRTCGLSVSIKDEIVNIEPQQQIPSQEMEVEADWSAAAFWFNWVAINGGNLRLPGLQQDSVQGDQKLVHLFALLGVSSHWDNGVLTLQGGGQKEKQINADLTEMPDIAQPLAFAAAACGVDLHLSGLSTLRIKETDRLKAIQEEWAVMGVKVQIDESSLRISSQVLHSPKRPLKTYDDHRMAMSMAPLCGLFALEIEHPEVVKKSYPSFWEDLKKLKEQTS